MYCCENLGLLMVNVFKVVCWIVMEYLEIEVIFFMYKNFKVCEIVVEYLGELVCVYLIELLDVKDF